MGRVPAGTKRGQLIGKKFKNTKQHGFLSDSTARLSALSCSTQRTSYPNNQSMRECGNRGAGTMGNKLEGFETDLRRDAGQRVVTVSKNHAREYVQIAHHAHRMRIDGPPTHPQPVLLNGRFPRRSRDLLHPLRFIR
jgi:hypothetical protein